MSSNGCSRSRPRVRHQRVPKKEYYAHPRFLQLVKELARLDDAKKKQEELEQFDLSGSSVKACPSIVATENNSIANNCADSISALSHQPGPDLQHHSSAPQQLQHPTASNQHQHQQLVDQDSRCSRSLNEASSSSTCRPSNHLECSHTTLALNDTFYCQLNNDNQQQILNHSLHPNYQRLYGYPPGRYQGYPPEDHNTPMNNMNHLQHDYRCPPSKCTAMPTLAMNGNIGCSKAGPNDRSAPNLPNTDADPRQDENRTKRKRSSADPSSSSKKLSRPASPSSCNKRHKASPEPVRPLSPSFTKCPICLLDCMDRDPSFTNTCFHLFCYVCIENWSKSKATCPLCRTKFSKIIYNIRSASRFDEKVASPVRRDEDDDRIYEQLHGLSANPIGSARAPSGDETRLLFDNLRNQNNDVIIPHFALLNQSLNRHTLQSFNPVSTNSPFNGSVPHAPFTAASYNSLASGYITLIPQNNRSQAPVSGPAITSAYSTNTSLNNTNGDSSNRAVPRMSRSGRFIYTRNYDLATVESASRVSRSTNTEINPPGLSIESRHHHHSMPHSDHHQQHSQPQQHRTTSSVELVTHRQVQRIDHHPHILPYLMPHRHYSGPNVYPRRPYNNPIPGHHVMDSLYRPMPDV